MIWWENSMKSLNGGQFIFWREIRLFQSLDQIMLLKRDNNTQWNKKAILNKCKILKHRVTVFIKKTQKSIGVLFIRLSQFTCSLKFENGKCNVIFKFSIFIRINIFRKPKIPDLIGMLSFVVVYLVVGLHSIRKDWA